MKIELKRIEHSERMSEETECFTADLWVDGVKIGTISNHGTGGCDDFHGDHVAFAAADAWCKANLPRWSLDEAHPDQHETDLEMHVASILAKHLGIKQMKRELAKHVVFQKAGDKGLYTITPKKGFKASDPRIHAQVLERHPGATILNTLPTETAYITFSECSE